MKSLNKLLFFPAFLVFLTLWMLGTFLAGLWGYFNLNLQGLGFKWKFYPEHLEGTMDKIAFHEYIWNTGAGKFGSVMGVVNNLGWGTMILAVFNLNQFFYLVPIAVLAYPLAVYAFGYFLHRIKYIYRQGDVNNRLMNPQLVRTEEKVGQLLEKMK